MKTYIIFILTLLLLVTACTKDKNSLVVTASAFTSHVAQTDAKPSLAAWGDTLTPGMKAIAVSRDLIELGLDHGVEVNIEGLPGTYVVLDKMDARWAKKIDIYMGKDLEKAKEWGVKEVIILWNKP